MKLRFLESKLLFYQCCNTSFTSHFRINSCKH